MGRFFSINLVNGVALLFGLVAYCTPLWYKLTFSVDGTNSVLSMGCNIFLDKWVLLGSDDSVLFAGVKESQLSSYKSELFERLTGKYFSDDVVNDGLRRTSQTMAGLAIVSFLAALFATSCIEKLMLARVSSFCAFLTSLLAWILSIPSAFGQNAADLCEGESRQGGFGLVNSEKLGACSSSGTSATNVFVNNEELSVSSIGPGFFLAVTASLLAFAGFFLTFTKFKSEEEEEESSSAKVSNDTYYL